LRFDSTNDTDNYIKAAISFGNNNNDNNNTHNTNTNTYNTNTLNTNTNTNTNTYTITNTNTNTNTNQGIVCSNPDFIHLDDKTNTNTKTVNDCNFSSFLRGIDEGLAFPDVNDNNVQQFLLSLLFNNDFISLVKDVEEYINKLQNKLQ